MGGSLLLAEERFERGDPSFINELTQCHGRPLRTFALKWARDQRPFARQAALDLALSSSGSGHERLLVKVLFKEAEQRGDDAMVAHFMVGFDGFIQRTARKEAHYNWHDRSVQDYWIRREDVMRSWDDFSIRTRTYLQRRAFRYFRRLSRVSPTRFIKGVCLALRTYPEDLLERPDAILDTMSLTRLLYGESDQLSYQGRCLGIDGKLNALEPAPTFATAWKTEPSFFELLGVLSQARSAFVRGWVALWLEAEHAGRLEKLPLSSLQPLLRSPHEETQEFGAKCLERLENWSTLSVDEWIQLALIKNEFLSIPLAQLMRSHLTPSRLSLEQCIALTHAAGGPIAELGLDWAKEKSLSGEQLALASQVVEATNPGVRTAGVEWLSERLSAGNQSLLVREWLDSRHEEVRDAALHLVDTIDSYQDDSRLHAAMSESPHGDVLDALVARLSEWRDHLNEESLKHVFATTFLAIRRGGRAKRRSLRLISEALGRSVEEAGPLLPLLPILLRSVRERERRAGLAAIARAAHAQPKLRPLLKNEVPELSLWEEGGAA